MKNHESGFSSDESSSEDSKKTTKEKSSSSSQKRPMHVPLEAPSASSEKSDLKPSLAESFLKAADKSEKPVEVPSGELAETAEVDRPTPEEEQYSAQEIAIKHQEAMQSVDAETAEALQPAAEFLERISQGQPPEQAFTEVANELGIEQEEIAAALEDGPEDMTDELDVVEQPPVPEQVFNPAEDDEGEIDLSSSTASSSSYSTATGSGSGSGGGGTVPPPPPNSLPVPGPTGGPTGPGSTTATFNAMPIPSTPNVLPAAANTYYSQRAKTGELLVVGLVGYLIGRRHGRIKAEKRLVPVQRKLEKQVRQLEKNITRKEQQLVAFKARNQERTSVGSAERPVRSPIERTQPGRRETRLGMQKPAKAEQLGHMVVTAEAPRVIERDKKRTPESIRQAFKPEEAKSMDRGELLALSEKIIVEGASLRRIYESRLIGEKQLRHLVGEHLQGHDIHKALRKEMVEHEIDFERDPILRDRVRSHLASNQGGSGLGDLLASVGIVEDQPDPQLQRHMEKEEKRRQEQERKHKQQRIITDSAMATAIVVLAVVVLIMALRS